VVLAFGYPDFGSPPLYNNIIFQLKAILKLVSTSVVYIEMDIHYTFLSTHKDGLFCLPTCLGVLTDIEVFSSRIFCPLAW
jgi:hypothetical protein